jgi:hypothetical protein
MARARRKDAKVKLASERRGQKPPPQGSRLEQLVQAGQVDNNAPPRAHGITRRRAGTTPPVSLFSLQ